MRTLTDYAMNESLRVKWVIRNGKRTKKWVTTKKGKYRVEMDAGGHPHEVRITAKEKRNRKLGQRRGKAKRLAKIGQIELRRKKSFVARKNQGMKYIPDLLGAVGNAVKKVVKTAKSGLDKVKRTLHPTNESLLCEAPHSLLFTDGTGKEWYWDFYAELVDDSSWLEQIIDIYTKHQIISLNPDHASAATIYNMSDGIVDEITDNLIDAGMIFASMVAQAYVKADPDLKERFRNSVPAKLFNTFIPYINRYEVKMG
jgi:hypothetical protein